MKLQILLPTLLPYFSRGAETMSSSLSSPLNYQNTSAQECGVDETICMADTLGDYVPYDTKPTVGQMKQEKAVDYSNYDFGVEQNIAGERMKEIVAFIDNWRSYMAKKVFVEPEYEPVKHICKNKHELCSFWALLGECDANPGYMKMNCAPACQSCEQLDFNLRCPLEPDMKNAFDKPGDVNKFFERIVNDEEFAKYNITVHSRPKRPDDDASFKDGPWLITFDNFITPEEANRLIALGGLEGYKRSTDVGTLKEDGSYTDYESSSRTSTNAWCFENTCMKDPVAKRVVDRIEHVTQIPQTNSESLQLLRYEKGQYYGTHNDLIEYQKNRPPGVRILTFYMYLNGNEENGLEGGGTKFPRVDITVTPKLGRAALWSSVLNEDPHSKDSRTDHTALPVKAGVKYGANAWIHQRDYMTPNKIGCT